MIYSPDDRMDPQISAFFNGVSIAVFMRSVISREFDHSFLRPREQGAFPTLRRRSDNFASVRTAHKKMAP